MEGNDSTRTGGWLDDRGVSEVIGSVLVFGLLIALLAIVQTQAVPNANAQVEAQHSTEVRGDMADLQSAISQTVRYDAPETTTVATGMNYPPRLVLYNPPPVQGTLSTGESGTASLRAFSAPEPDTDEYISPPGATLGPSFETHTISYRVDYNRYDNAPTTRYEHGAMVSEFEDGTTTVDTSGNLVSGNHITLVMLRGGLEESQVRASSVRTHPVSAPAQTVTIETNSGTQGRLTVPTELSQEVWLTQLMADQIDSNAPGGVTDCSNPNFSPSSYTPNPTDDRYIVGCEYDASAGEITFLFEADQTYELRLAKVGFSAENQQLEPEYITDVTSGSTDGLVVEVRDEFNNPIERRVDLTVVQFDPDGNVEEKTDIKTGPDGRARLPGDLVRDAEVYLREGSNQGTPQPLSGSRNPTCTDELGCAKVEPPGLPASSLIRVTNVSADDSANTVTYSFTNSGDRDTNISEVQLGYATQRSERTLTVAVGQVSNCVGVDIANCLTSEQLTTTLVDDGPNSIENLTTSSVQFQPNGSTGAQENLEPVRFDDNGQSPGGNPPELASGTTSDVEFGLDENIELSGSNSIDVSVTVYYEDGSVATYSRTLYNEDGDQGQSP